MPATAFNAQSAVARHARARHYTPCMWGGGATLELATHARRAARIVVGLSNMKVRCTSDEALFFVLRPWCDVAAVASNAKPAAAYEASAQAAPLVVSREKAQHSNLQHLNLQNSPDINVHIHTTAKTDHEAKLLLTAMRFPFRP